MMTLILNCSAAKVCPLTEIALIPLTRGYYVIVDRKDYESLSQFRWYAETKKNGTYAARWCLKEKRHMYMHRWLMQCPTGMVVHHKNHVTLDNRESNLQTCTKGENNGYRK